GNEEHKEQSPSQTSQVQPTGQATAEKTPVATKQPDPVELSLAVYAVALTDAEFKSLIADPVAQKYPHITMKYNKETNMDKLIAAGQIPDLLYANSRSFPTIVGLELQYDMNDLVKKYNFDLGKYQPYVMDLIKSLGDGTKLYGIP